MMRIGHRGAAALAPANSLRSIERALEVGVDMVEVDVLALAEGTLVLAHSTDLPRVSRGVARRRVADRTLAELRTVAPDLATLDEALALVAAREVAVQLDVKRPGYELALVEAVRRHGVVGRTLVSSGYAEVLRRVGMLEPGLRRGLTYPFDRRGLSRWSYLSPAVWAALSALRVALPHRIGGLLARGDASVATLHYLVVSAAALRACHERGVQVLAWTVDDPRLVMRLAQLGVDGVITNDPRIFPGTF